MAYTIVYGQEAQLIPWACQQIEGVQFNTDAKAIGVMRGGAIAAACVFDEFTPHSCAIAIASDGSKRWMTREFLWRCFAYPFLQCGLRRIGSCVSANNQAALTLNRRIGLKEEGVLREAGLHGEDLIMFGMLARECRFI